MSYISLTAQCDKCKDIFTVWGKLDGKDIKLEAQSRLLHKTKQPDKHRNFIPIHGLYHHCGGKLYFFG